MSTEPIDWRAADPATIPEGSPVRLALEEGRPDVAEWIASRYPDGARLYVHSEGTHRRLLFERAARDAVGRGDLSARAASRRYGVPRGRLPGYPSGRGGPG